RDHSTIGAQCAAVMGGVETDDIFCCDCLGRFQVLGETIAHQCTEDCAAQCSARYLTPTSERRARVKKVPLTKLRNNFCRWLDVDQEGNRCADALYDLLISAVG